MAFKDIIAVVTSQSQDEHVIAFAEQLTKQFSARMVTLVVRWQPDLAITDASELLKVEVSRTRDRLARMTEGGAVHSQLFGIDRARTAIGLWARHFDVTVTGRPDAPTDDWPHALLEGALFESGRPVFVVPPGWKPREIGRRVFLCWKPTREAARALAEAGDLLSTAERVTVGVASPELYVRDADACADVISHLSRKEIEASPVRIDSTHRNEAEALLERAQAERADLVILGGYGHSRIVQFLWGGITRDMLAKSTIPMLMAH